MRFAALIAVALVALTTLGQAQPVKSIRRAEAQMAWEKSAMSVYDFLTDAKSLMGKTVSVHGVAECMGELICYLRDPDNPTLQVVIEPSALHRDDLKHLEACHAGSMKCETTITGRVAENDFGELRLAGKAK